MSKWRSIQWACCILKVLPTSIWTGDGMQSFKDFTSECRRQVLALVFHRERQTDNPAFAAKTCAIPFFRSGRTARSREREDHFKTHVTSHIWSDQVWGNTVWISNWIFQVLAFSNVFDIILGLGETAMCEITVWLLWDKRDPFGRGQAIKLVSSLRGNEALDWVPVLVTQA